jgi:hypothetical protein
MTTTDQSKLELDDEYDFADPNLIDYPVTFGETFQLR